MATTLNTNPATISITKDFARKCADTLVKTYNDGYDTRDYVCNAVQFRQLYLDLQSLDFGWLIASAKGDQDIRDYAFGRGDRKDVITRIREKNHSK